MKFHEIALSNFRQFREAHIVFGDETTSGFNLVVGTNGAGKTTLLSAIHFALYGDLLTSLRSERLLNETVFEDLNPGDVGVVTVSLKFSHLGSNYLLRRSTKVKREDKSEIRLDESLSLTNADSGESISPPQRWVNNRFPSNLAKFLLFPGELLQGFFEEDKFGLLARDIKSLAGLDKLDFLADSAERVKASIDDRIRRIPGDETVGRLLEQKNGTNLELEKIRERHKDVANALKDSKVELQSKNRILNERRSQSALLQEIDMSKKTVSRLEAALNEQRQAKVAFMQNAGWVSFVSGISETLREHLKNMDARGLLGSAWPRAAISELLSSGRCICGCSLEESSPPFEAVKALLSENAKVEATLPYQALVDSLSDGLLNFDAATATWQKFISDELKAEERLESARATLGKQQNELADSGADSYLSELVNRVLELETLSIPKLEQDLLELGNKVAEKEDAVRILDEKWAEATARQQNHGPLLRQHASLLRVLASIRADSDSLNDRLRSELKTELEAALPPVYDNRPVEVEVSTSFGIKISRNGLPMSEASGEEQLRAICTVSVLNMLAKNYTLPGQSDDEKSDFPLVIDAGFSHMGETFRQQALEFLKKGSDQVVILLLPDQAAVPLRHIGPQGFASKHLLHKFSTGVNPNPAREYEKIGDLGVRVQTFESDSPYTQIEVLTLDS